MILQVVQVSSATTDNTTTSSDNTTSSFSVSEITQTTGNGYKIGSFVVPSNGLSFTLSIFSDNNSLVYFASLTDPDASNLLDNTSTPNIYAQTSGFGALSYGGGSMAGSIFFKLQCQSRNMVIHRFQQRQSISWTANRFYPIIHNNFNTTLYYRYYLVSK